MIPFLIREDKKWRAKDILFIASDSKYGHHGIQYWLDHYSTSISSNLLQNRNISNMDDKVNRGIFYTIVCISHVCRKSNC